MLICVLAAAAARIKASIEAKKGIQHVDVPPIRSTQSPAASASPAPKAENSASTINGDMYIADGDYIRDIEVNDLRNRYTLTKGSTQKMVNIPCDSRPTNIRVKLLHRSKQLFVFLFSSNFPRKMKLEMLSCFPHSFLCGDDESLHEARSNSSKTLIGIC